MLCRSSVGYLYSSHFKTRLSCNTNHFSILIIYNAHSIITSNLIIALLWVYDIFLVTQLPKLLTESSNLLLKVLPCGLLFRVLSFWGYSREYARAYGSTLIFFGTFTCNCGLLSPATFDHSVILVVTLWHHPQVHVRVHTHEKTHMIILCVILLVYRLYYTFRHFLLLIVTA